MRRDKMTYVAPGDRNPSARGFHGRHRDADGRLKQACLFGSSSVEDESGCT